MINTDIVGYPVKVNREFVYCGLHKAGEVIKYNFCPAHRRLLESGAISEFDPEMYEYKYINRETYTIHGKKYQFGEDVDVSDLSNRELEVFIKQRIISKDLKDEYKPDELKEVKPDVDYTFKPKDMVVDTSEVEAQILGMTFKDVCTTYSLDVDKFCEKLGGRKVGLHLRKVTKANIQDVLKAL